MREAWQMLQRGDATNAIEEGTYQGANLITGVGSTRRTMVATPVPQKGVRTEIEGDIEGMMGGETIEIETDT